MEILWKSTVFEGNIKWREKNKTATRKHGAARYGSSGASVKDVVVFYEENANNIKIWLTDHN